MRESTTITTSAVGEGTRFRGPIVGLGLGFTFRGFKRAGALTGLTLLLAVAPAAAGMHDGGGSGMASASAWDGDHRTPPLKSVFRRYGGGAVRQDAWNQPVRIAFRGRGGDVVGARTDADPSSGEDVIGCQRIRLATGAGDRVRQGRSDFWTLPRRGRYVLTYTQDCWLGGNSSGDSDEPAHRRAVSVQLLKVRTHPLVPGEGMLTMPVSRAYVDVAEVRLTGRRPIVVDAAAYVAEGKLSGEFDRIITSSSISPVRAVGQVVDSDGCFDRAPVTIKRGKPLIGSTYQGGADGLYPVAAPLVCDRDARRHVAKRGDTFWFFNEERPLAVEALRLR